MNSTTIHHVKSPMHALAASIGARLHVRLPATSKDVDGVLAKFHRDLGMDLDPADRIARLRSAENLKRA